MLTLVPEAIDRYATEHTSAVPPIYEELRIETYASQPMARMQVGPLEGRLLTLLARLVGARRALEVGTFTGYSALSIAEGMTDDGRLITCDIDPETNAIARRYFARAPWGSRIEPRLGDARATIASLDGDLDLVFLDADKESYIAYWEALVPRVRPGGLLIADNVLWSGKVLNPTTESDHAIVDFNQHVKNDPRVDQVMLTVRDGVTVARKR